MNLTVIIITGIVTLAAYFSLYRRPAYIISLYLIATPVLPPIPLGGIEISILDMLAVPTLIAIIYIMPSQKYRLDGYFNISLLFYVMAAVISYIGFLLTTGLISFAIIMRLIRLIEIFLPVLLASYLITKFRFKDIVAPFLIGGTLASIIALIFYATGFTLRTSQSFAAQGFEYFRAAGTHGDSGSFGNLAGITLLISCWILIYKEKLFSREKSKSIAILAVISAISSLAALAISLSRGGMALFVIGFLILLIPMIKQPLKIVKIVAIGLVSFFIGAALINMFVDNHLVSISIDAFWTRITGLSEIADNFEQVSSSRSYYWLKSWELFREMPLAWPFGLGYKSLPLHYNLLADNNFNQALFEMGILGGITFLFMIILGLYAGLKALYKSLPYGIMILALWIALISNMISADLMTYWHNISAIFILLSFFYFRAQIVRENSPD